MFWNSTKSTKSKIEDALELAFAEFKKGCSECTDDYSVEIVVDADKLKDKKNVKAGHREIRYDFGSGGARGDGFTEVSGDSEFSNAIVSLAVKYSNSKSLPPSVFAVARIFRLVSNVLWASQFHMIDNPVDGTLRLSLSPDGSVGVTEDPTVVTEVVRTRYFYSDLVNRLTDDQLQNNALLQKGDRLGRLAKCKTNSLVQSLLGGEPNNRKSKLKKKKGGTWVPSPDGRTAVVRAVTRKDPTRAGKNKKEIKERRVRVYVNPSLPGELRTRKMRPDPATGRRRAVYVKLAAA